MNMRKKLREFFTLTRRANEGFTLVELIIVIAIVAILGGVAVPAYSGYIAKADAAADAQLLGDINKAFAAACMVEGIDNYNAPVTAPEVGQDGKIGSIAVTGVEDFNNTFIKFFDNTGAFKKTTRLQYNAARGGFEDADKAGGIFAQIFNSLDLGTFVETVNDSTFGKIIGAKDLMLKVHDVTGLAEELLALPAGNSLKNALSADIDTIAASMGMSTTELQTLIASQEDSNGYYNNLLSNYAVLQVANTTAGKNTATLLADLKNGMTTSDISNMIASNDTKSSKEGVAKAAMMYAMYTAYANQLEDGDQKTAALNNLKDMDTFVTAIGTETAQGSGFMTYLGSDQATTDMDGFRASMNIITNSTENNTEATRDLLENGYNNTELISALQGLMGK